MYLRYVQLESYKKRKGTRHKKILNIMAKNFPNLIMDTKLHIKETQSTPRKVHAIQNRHTDLRHNCQKQGKEENISKVGKNQRCINTDTNKLPST